jgi:protein-S-isoprenylcysteine O-methyltransferase Ste14
MRLLLAFKILLFTLLVPGTVIFYIPYALVSDSNGNLLLPANLLLAFPALACFLLGLALYLRCAWDFAVIGLGTPAPIDPPKTLVVTRPYLWNRNPMYMGIFLILFAECLLFLNTGLLMYTSAVVLIFNAIVVFYEEPLLHKKFGDAYSQYCNKVPRWSFVFRAPPIDSD